ncbi:MAG: hypothetical protein O3C10_10155 [Chloroflexi bacterium]|nr:hypothetical protein [Chloroflexota bacterium]
MSISAGIFVSAEAAIDGKTVDRNGGELWLKADGSGGPFEEGGLIGHNIDGLAPLEIVSVVGDPYLDLDTRFANGDVKNIWVDADIFNPNDIPVRYFPGFEAKIHVDSSPLGYVAPAGETFDTSFIGIETWSYGERALFVLDSLDGAERDWRYEYSTRGLWHVFDEAIVAAPGEVALNEILILPLDPGPTENSFSEAKPEFDATLASVGGPDPDEFEVPDGGNGGVTIKVDSAQGFLGFANPNLVGTTDLRSASEGPASTVNSTSGDTGVGATSPERSLAGASANAIEPNRDVPDVTDPKLTPDDPEPDAQRGFFVNPAPGNSVDLPLADLADPAVLSVIGILVTLFGATVQLAREQ